MYKDIYQIDRQIDRQIVDRKTDRQTDGQTERQIDRWIDRLMLYSSNSLGNHKKVKVSIQDKKLVSLYDLVIVQKYLEVPGTTFFKKTFS